MATLAGLDEGTFTEGHELDRKTEKQVPKAMIGRRLSQEEAKRVLINLHADRCPLSPPSGAKGGHFLTAASCHTG